MKQQRMAEFAKCTSRLTGIWHTGQNRGADPTWPTIHMPPLLCLVSV